jgi:hypothetical protein
MTRVSRLEALEEARLASGGGALKSLMPGIKPSSATSMARRSIKAARAFGSLHGLDVAYELQDNATLALHFSSSRRRISESLRIPLQFGYKVRRPFREIGLAETVGQYLPREPWEYAFFEESPVAKAGIWRQPEFIARGFFRPGKRGKYEAISAGERVVGQVESMFGMIGPKNISQELRTIQKTVEETYKTAIFGGSLSPYEYGAPIESPAAILQASQMQVLSERGEPLAETLKKGKTFPIDVKGGFRRERAYEHLLAMRKQQFLKEAGLSDLPLKPEAGIKSFVTAMRHGHLVPFGQYADPTRQTYQRWALMPLAERARPVGVTTEMFEAAATAVSPAGGRRSFRLPTNVLYTADPRIERAIAASQGGMIVSGPVQKALRYTLGGEARMPGVGSALIAGMGGKFTISAIAEMGPDIGAVASMKLLRKGGEAGFVTKHPEAVRKLIVEEILSQVGTLKPGGPRQAAKLSFLKKLSGEVSGKLVLHKKGRYTRYPQIQLGPEADLNLDKIERLVRSYNKQAGSLGGITTGIRRVSTDIIGIGGEAAEDVMGYMAPDWLGVRANQELGVINYAMRRGQPVKGIGGAGLSYTPAYGKGMKIRLKDIANIAIYGEPESAALAKILTQSVEQASMERKQDIFKTFLPILGTHTVAGGIKLDTLREAHPFIGLPTGQAEFLTEELAGTIFDPSHPFYKGFTLNLDDPIRVPGLHADVWTTQVHMPGMETLGLMPETKVVDGVERTLYHISPAQRAVYKTYRQAFADPTGLRETVVESLDAISRASLGKTGLIRKAIEPRMGQSGYFRLVGMGEGAAAKALGTELQPVKLATGEVIHQAATVAISEADVRAMGLLKEFKQAGEAPSGYMFGLMSAYPAQSYAHNRAVLYKMIGAAEAERLGPGGLGTHQALAIQMLRDNDADNVGTLFISGKRGQQVLRKLAARHHAPEIEAQARILEKLLSEEQRMLKGMGNAPSVVDPAVLTFKELQSYADDTVSAASHMAQRTAAARAEQFYGVKAMTPALNWWAGRMQTFLGEQASQSEQKAAKAILSAVEQAGAVAKGAGVATEASAIVDFSSKMSTQFLAGGALEKQERAEMMAAVKALHTKALESGEGILATYGPRQRGQLNKGLMAILHASRTWRTAAEEGKAFPKTLAVALTKAPGDEPIKAALQAVSAGDESLIKALEAEQATLARAAGLSQLVESGAVIPGGPHVAGPAAANQALIESGGLGKELPPPILDRVIDWFRRPSTPHYQKALVLGGGVLLGGAVVKNMLFPGFVPNTEDGMSPRQVAVPIPIRMPNAEQAQMPGIFDRIPGNQPVTSSFSMPPDFVGFGTRTPVPAVQMGAGTMQPGVLPKLMGDMFREAPPAPMVLNQDAYNQSTAGMAAPPVARAAEPLETPQRAFNVSARAPSSGFDLRALTRDMPSVDVRVMMEEDESELSILRSLSENDYSAFS